MFSCLRNYFLASLLLTSAALYATAGPPNWKSGGTGDTTIFVPPTPTSLGVDYDEFFGRSTLLGRFTGEGFHTTFPDFTFAGTATWTAANGDELHVEYAGQIYFGPDPDYPFAFVADLHAVDGTGRFQNTLGLAEMTGAFTGVPGEFYFDFSGTLKLK